MSRTLAVAVALVLGVLAYLYFFPSTERLVVYCALDREFAEPILEEFTRRTGVQIDVRWDTEANKSVGLYEDLIREKNNPRCDVHWNNEILATIRLQKAGLLEPYDSPSAKDIPAAFKASDHTWTGFAARCRVIIYNKDLMKDEEPPNSMEELIDPRWKGRVAMARPQFGTTATQAACLFEVWGSAKAQEYYRELKENEVLVLPGNKQVAEAVGAGKIAVGLTDTDDAFAEVDAERPVGLVYLAFSGEDELELIDCPQFIPNTVAIVRNCPSPMQARQLVDFLLSPWVERMLSKAASRQFPLNSELHVVPQWDGFKSLAEWRLCPGTFKHLPPPSPGPPRWADYAKCADRWDESQRFLAKLFEPR